MNLIKKYQVKVFEKDGITLIETINPNEIRNKISFKSSMNSGLGELRIVLNRKFDDYDEGGMVDIINIVKVFEFDAVNINPKLIYTGFVSQYTPFTKGDADGVEMTCLGLISMFKFSKFTDGGNFTFSRSAEDPSVTMQAIVDSFDLDYSDLVTTNLTSIGTDITPTFEKQDHFQALQQTFEQTGGGHYWTLDENGVLNLVENPTTATHTFTIGKDVQGINTEKSSEEVINNVTLFYGALLGSSINSTDAISINNYGKREEIFNDSNITDATTAQQFVDQKIAENKDLKIKAIVQLNQDFNFENISPGDTCKILNRNADDTTFSNNMQIISTSYTPEIMTLQISAFRLSFGKELQKFIS